MTLSLDGTILVIVPSLVSSLRYTPVDTGYKALFVSLVVEITTFISSAYNEKDTIKYAFHCCFSLDFISEIYRLCK